MMIRIASLFVLALIATGCTYSGRFTVGVVNRTDQPLSVGLVKNGPPMESNWASPFDIDMANPHLTDRKWGTLVPPGEAIVLGPQPGRFAAGVFAVLRVYSGDLPVEDLLTISPGNPDRLDIPLDNGASGYVIRRGPDGLLTASPAPPPPAR